MVRFIWHLNRLSSEALRNLSQEEVGLFAKHVVTVFLTILSWDFSVIHDITKLKYLCQVS